MMKDKVEKSKNKTNSSKGSVEKDSYSKMRGDVTDMETEKTGKSMKKRMSHESNSEIPLQMAGDAQVSNKMQRDSEVNNGLEDTHGGETIGGEGSKKKKKKVYQGRNIDEIKVKKMKLKQGGYHSDSTTVNTEINENEVGNGETQLEDIMRKERKKEKKRRKELKSQDTTSQVTKISVDVNEHGNGAGKEQLEEGVMGNNTKSLRKEREKEKKRVKELKLQDITSDSCGDGSSMVERNNVNITLTEGDNAERNHKVTPTGAEDRSTDENMIKKKKKKKKVSDGSRVTATRDKISANEGEREQLEGQSGDKLKRKSETTGNLSTEKRRKRDEIARADAESKDMSEESTPKKSSKRVSFAEEVEVLEDSLVRGKRFSPEEDEIVKKAVLEYISAHNLGEQGLDMVLHCRRYPEVKNCWQEIGLAIPHRPHSSVYYRAHILFERDDNHHWTKEEQELVRDFYAKHGADWKTLGKILGKSRIHVKDFWRRTCMPNSKKGKWDQKEYQELFDNLNVDLQVRALQENKSTKHGMLRDNIAWTAISRKLETRSQDICCMKWYGQLTSPMVVKGEWADTDDYRLVKSLYELDACCMEDVDWNNLIEYRSGDVCRQRWNQMVKHLGEHRTKPFPEQVNFLAERYCPSLLEVREAYDNLPVES